MLKVGNLDSFYMNHGGCNANGPVRYRVYTRMPAATLESYGGGWSFVNEPGRSKEDVDDVATILPESYYLPVYQVTQPFKEVLVQRISANWCDSWGRQTGHWVSSEGASMGVQADGEYLYTYNNEGGRHIWLRQPTSYLGAGNCNHCWLFNNNCSIYFKR